MRPYCSHCHAGDDEKPCGVVQLFWRTVALVAGLWLAIAIEMLRRSHAHPRHGTGPEGCAFLPVASNDH